MRRVIVLKGAHKVDARPFDVARRTARSACPFPAWPSVTQPRGLAPARFNIEPLLPPGTQPISRRTPTPIPPTMSSIIARSAFRAAPRVVRPTPAFRRWASAAAEGEREAGKAALKTGAKRDPELYVRCRHVHYNTRGG
jgi:hypothetical protein